MAEVKLKEIKRKVYMSYFQDGLWDILLGVFLVGWGLIIQFDIAALGGALVMTFYFIILALKKWLTYPRAGYVKIAEERRQKIKMTLLGAVIFGLGSLVFLLFLPGEPPSWLSDYFIILFGCMIALITSLLAYWWSVLWWYSYAVLVVIGAAFHQWLNTPLAPSFIIPGAVIMLSGLLLLIRFLVQHPKLIEERSGDNQ